MSKKRILVVDDEINVAKSIKQSILSDDLDVDLALSGEEALKMDAQNNYDLIITDLMMPGISGLDLLKQLKQKPLDYTPSANPFSSPSRHVEN